MTWQRGRDSVQAMLSAGSLDTISGAAATGHHVTTEQVVRAQIGGPFDSFATLRRRRVEIEYPRFPGDDIDETEVLAALDKAQRILDSAIQLLPQLSLFRP